MTTMPASEMQVLVLMDFSGTAVLAQCVVRCAPLVRNRVYEAIVEKRTQRSVECYTVLTVAE
ncbi:MAG: hypothetical protein U0V64_08710 [Cyclobacteriaceae bacterium]